MHASGVVGRRSLAVCAAQDYAMTLRAKLILYHVANHVALAAHAWIRKA